MLFCGKFCTLDFIRNEWNIVKFGFNENGLKFGFFHFWLFLRLAFWQWFTIDGLLFGQIIKDTTIFHHVIFNLLFHNILSLN